MRKLSKSVKTIRMRIFYPSLFLPTFADHGEIRLKILKFTKVLTLLSYLFYIINIITLEVYFNFFKSYYNFVAIVHGNNFDTILMLLFVYIFRPNKQQFTFIDETNVKPDVNLY